MYVYRFSLCGLDAYVVRNILVLMVVVRFKEYRVLSGFLDRRFCFHM